MNQPRKYVRFTRDDLAGLWKRGEIFEDCGLETPGLPIQVLRRPGGKTITIEDPYNRDLLEPATQQEAFEERARAAQRELERGCRTLAEAATLADDLGDEGACGALHMLREAIARQAELIEEEVGGVDIRLAG